MHVHAHTNAKQFCEHANTTAQHALDIPTVLRKTSFAVLTQQC